MVVNTLGGHLSHFTFLLIFLSLIFACDSSPEAFNFVSNLGLLNLLLGFGGIFRYGIACQFSSYFCSLISFFEILDRFGLFEDDAVHGSHVLGSVPFSSFSLVLLGDASFVVNLVLLEQFE